MLNPIKVVVHGYMGDIIAKESVCENLMKGKRYSYDFYVLLVNPHSVYWIDQYI